MPDELVRDLKRTRSVGLVFSRNGRPLNPWTTRDNSYSLVERLGLPKIWLHDLRRLQATILLSSGVDLATVSARLGHSSKAFTLQTYTHATGQEKATEAAGPFQSQ